MRYPQFKNYLEINPFDGDDYLIYDSINEHIYLAHRSIVAFAARLDGKTDPFSIDPTLSRREVRRIMSTLRYCHMLRHSRVLMKSFGSIYITMWIPFCAEKYQSAAKRGNLLLMLLFLPVLAAGAAAYFLHPPSFDHSSFLLGLLFGTAVGLLLHELGHFQAGIAYGADVYELGAMIQNFMPGAYNLMKESNITNKLPRVQIYGAGVEMNLLLGGLFLLLTSFLKTGSSFFYMAAFSNLIFAPVNLMFIKGLDGAKIIEILLDAEGVMTVGLRELVSPSTWKSAFEEGAEGVAFLLTLFLFSILKISLPLLFVYNILALILGIAG